MSSTVTAVFEQPSDATRAIDRLHDAGFSGSDISVITSESVGRSGFKIEKGSKAAEGAAIGGGIGAGVAAIIAGLTAVGAIATGGIGLLAAGPIVAALAAAGAGAAAGGLVGGLVGLGIPEHQAKTYEGQIAKGGTLVGVKAVGDRATIVKDIFNACSAESVATV